MLLGIVLLAVGCAGARPAAESPPLDDTVTRDQIVGTGALTVYDALRALRPAWLRKTSDGGRLGNTVRAGQPSPSVDRRCSWTVYVGARGRVGDQLRRIDASLVQEIRLIQPHAPRPDGSRCDHDYPVIHVLLADPQPNESRGDIVPFHRAGR